MYPCVIRETRYVLNTNDSGWKAHQCPLSYINQDGGSVDGSGPKTDQYRTADISVWSFLFRQAWFGS